MSLRTQLLRALDPAGSAAPLLRAEGRWWTRAELAHHVERHASALLDNDARPDHTTRTAQGIRKPPRRFVSIPPKNDLETVARIIATVRADQVPLLRSPASPAPTTPLPRATTAIALTTSGTTGPPSVIELSEQQLMGAVLAGRGHTEPRPDRTSLICHPIGHIGGMWALLDALLARRRLVLLPRFTVESWIAAVADHRIAATFLVPAALRMLLASTVPEGSLASLRLITTGAAACPVSVATEVWERFRIPVLSTYGATEFGGAVAGWDRALFHQWWPRKAGSVGRALHGVQIEAVPDGSGTEVLRVRGAQTGGAWFETRDRGRVDPDGFIWLDGRTDDVINRGGFKIDPHRIVQVLIGHPDVMDAAVTGLPDERLGQVPGAVIQPVGRAPSDDELLRHCRSRLAAYECPVHFVVGQVPRTPAGKVPRASLDAMFRVVSRPVRENRTRAGFASPRTERPRPG